MAKAQGTTARHFLSLDGLSINLISYGGGNISAETIKENVGPDTLIKKRLGSIRYEDFIFETRLSIEIKEIIKKAWDGESLPSSGSVITTDANYKALYEDFFTDLMLTETMIPECDSASKESVVFKLKFKPAFIRNQNGDGKIVQASPGTRQKAMLRSNFRLELGSLPCSRVASIDSFNVVTNQAIYQIGNNRTVQKANSAIDFPNLFLNISRADFQPWMEWHKEFISDGKNSESDELTGRLVFLAPDLKEELLAIRLDGVGIFSLQRNENFTGTISRFRVGLYCEQMTIEN